MKFISAESTCKFALHTQGSKGIGLSCESRIGACPAIAGIKGKRSMYKGGVSTEPCMRRARK
jgi:hypothetical protein